jgi:biopolymer transport protein TolR
MSVRYSRHQRKAMSEINVVPYIDVMLVLLVIFMITAPLLSQGVKVDLPKASAKQLPVKGKGPVVVSVDKKGCYYLNVVKNNDAPMEASQLVTRVVAELSVAKESGDERLVLVKGDRHVNYGKVVQMMVLLQRAGVEKVGLMTENTLG